MSLLAAVVALVLPAPAAAADRPPCATDACRERVARRHWRRTVRPHRQWIDRVAACESGGRWSLATGNGFYGGLQFTVSSWRAVGGRGMPHTCSRLEQMYRGVLLLRVQGRGAWPTCG